MKKFLFYLTVILFFSTSVNAGEIPDVSYENIKIKSKISVDSSSNKWFKGKKTDLYFVKTKGFGEFCDYLTENGDFAFTTDCEFEFIKDGRFIGYSNKNLTFYELSFQDGTLKKEMLTKEEVQALFPSYRVISCSDFSKYTNSIKIKKGFLDLKLLIFNDSEKDFDGYSFSSGNAKFETYKINGLITVSKSGMIQFAKDEENSEQNPWYVILVR